MLCGVRLRAVEDEAICGVGTISGQNAAFFAFCTYGANWYWTINERGGWEVRRSSMVRTPRCRAALNLDFSALLNSAFKKCVVPMAQIGIEKKRTRRLGGSEVFDGANATVPRCSKPRFQRTPELRVQKMRCTYAANYSTVGGVSLTPNPSPEGRGESGTLFRLPRLLTPPQPVSQTSPSRSRPTSSLLNNISLSIASPLARPSLRQESAHLLYIPDECW
jgi:hypothetical protein